MPTPVLSIYNVTCRRCGLIVQAGKPIKNWICVHCNGSFYRQQTWKALWQQALKNMPAMAICTVREKDDQLKAMGATDWSYRRGSATALRMCLGYQVYSATGRSNAVAANYNAIQRGSKPRGADRQRMLRALAGPHGAVIARARLIQIGQAHRFSIWPTGATHG